ncbi:MAG: helix-turn-helix domain-containing protein [Culicoidibacterales bacterium]
MWIPTYHTINIRATLRKKVSKWTSNHEHRQIKAYLDAGYTRYAIAKKLGRSFNTIQYEIIRGTVKQIKAGKEVQVSFPTTGHFN